MKAIVESFEECCFLVTQAKVSMQTTGLATQLLKFKDQYQWLVGLMEMVKSAKYTIKEAVPAMLELDLGEDTCSISRYIQKYSIQNNDISKIVNMERPNSLSAVYILLEHSQPTTASVERSFSCCKNR